jgi:cytochrome oxidase Cu insertion factor (SCO1/SenC/PrrC family)
MLCAIIIALGLAVFWNYLHKLKRDSQAQLNRPPVTRVLQKNLDLIDDSGKKFSISDLQGKVWICAYVYTRCPRSCAGTARYMKQIADEFKDNPNFKAVAITLHPEEDTPEFLKAWRQAHELLGDHWVFLTGDGPKIRGYMQDEFKLPLREIPEKERLSPFDRWDHKAAIVLVDGKRQVRTTADVGAPASVDLWVAQLIKNIKIVLEEK